MPRLRRSKSMPGRRSTRALVHAADDSFVGASGRVRPLVTNPAMAAAAHVVHARLSPRDTSEHLNPVSVRGHLLRTAMLHEYDMRSARPLSRSRSDPPPRTDEVKVPALHPPSGDEKALDLPLGDEKELEVKRPEPPLSPRFPGDGVDLAPEDDLVSTSVLTFARRLGLDLDPNADLPLAENRLLFNGHGTYVASDGSFVVPHNVTIEFCSQHGVSVSGTVSADAPVVERLEAGEVCQNYRAWPLYGGGMTYRFRSDEAFILGDTPTNDLTGRVVDLRESAAANAVRRALDAYKLRKGRAQRSNKPFNDPPPPPVPSTEEQKQIDRGTPMVVGVHGWGVELQYLADVLGRASDRPVVLKWLACREVIQVPEDGPAPAMGQTNDRGISQRLQDPEEHASPPRFANDPDDEKKTNPRWSSSDQGVEEVDLYQAWRQQQHAASRLDLPPVERRQWLRQELTTRAGGGDRQAQAVLDAIQGLPEDEQNAILDSIRLMPP